MLYIGDLSGRIIVVSSVKLMQISLGISPQIVVNVVAKFSNL